MIISEQCIRSNMLPTWRRFYLSEIAQLRMMIRDGRQVLDAKLLIKRVQRSAASARRQWRAAA